VRVFPEPAPAVTTRSSSNARIRRCSSLGGGPAPAGGGAGVAGGSPAPPGVLADRGRGDPARPAEVAPVARGGVAGGGIVPPRERVLDRGADRAADRFTVRGDESIEHAGLAEAVDRPGRAGRRRHPPGPRPRERAEEVGEELEPVDAARLGVDRLAVVTTDPGVLVVDDVDLFGVRIPVDPIDTPRQVDRAVDGLDRDGRHIVVGPEGDLEARGPEAPRGAVLLEPVEVPAQRARRPPCRGGPHGGVAPLVVRGRARGFLERGLDRLLRGDPVRGSPLVEEVERMVDDRADGARLGLDGAGVRGADAEHVALEEPVRARTPCLERARAPPAERAVPDTPGERGRPLRRECPVVPAAGAAARVRIAREERAPLPLECLQGGDALGADARPPPRHVERNRGIGSREPEVPSHVLDLEGGDERLPVFVGDGPREAKGSAGRADPFGDEERPLERSLPGGAEERPSGVVVDCPPLPVPEDRGRRVGSDEGALGEADHRAVAEVEAAGVVRRQERDPPPGPADRGSPPLQRLEDRPAVGAPSRRRAVPATRRPEGVLEIEHGFLPRSGRLGVEPGLGQRPSVHLPEFTGRPLHASEILERVEHDPQRSRRLTAGPGQHPLPDAGRSAARGSSTEDGEKRIGIEGRRGGRGDPCHEIVPPEPFLE